MTTLYRRYRPQTFGDIAGQSSVVHTLREAIAQNRLAHAYLFYGPRGTGKTTMARIFAAGVNGHTTVPESNQIDVIEIDAASNRSIDDIRALRENVAIRPTRGKYKVYIIDEVHMLTGEAFAALLKTLEEPQAHAIFILATTELHKVPATIVSRCQVYRFRRATSQEMKTRLLTILKAEKREIDDDALDFIVSRSDGCYRDGESLLGQILTAYPANVTLEQLSDFLGLPSHQAIANFLEALVRQHSAPALQVLDEAFAAGYDPEQFIKESILAARNQAVAAGDPKMPGIIRALLQAIQDLAFVPQPFIALQLVVLSVCTAKGPPPTITTVKAEAVLVKPKLFSLEQVREVWPKLIDALREAGNPVASTFLRAIEPIQVDGGVITGQATYALHRTYFDKPENKKLVGGALTTLLGQPAALRCIVSDQKQPVSTPVAATNELLDAVKEVFG